MKRKILSVALAAFVLLFAFSCNQNAGSSGSPSKFKILAVDSVGEVGRYQLFNGTYRFFDYRNKKTENRQAVFLLDTQTGLTKIYHEGLNVDGRKIIEWIRFADQEEPPQMLTTLPDSSRLSAEDKQAIEWANANPNDPRAKQIHDKIRLKLLKLRYGLE